MKVCVKVSAIAADSFTVLPHGIVYINEELEPRLAKRVAVLCQKYPEDIFLYEGELEGLDIKGSRNQELDAQADAEANEILAKAKAQKENKDEKEKEKQKAEAEAKAKAEAEAQAQAEADAEAEEKAQSNTNTNTNHPENKTGVKANAPKQSRAK
jgi:hypothetical protein